MLPDLKSKIKQLFAESKVDCILLFNGPGADPNFFYLTRMEKSEFNHSILIVKKNSMTFLVPKMEYGLAKEQSKKSRTVVKAFGTSNEMEDLIKKETMGRKVGLNLSKISVNSFKSLKKIFKGKKFIDVSMHLAKIRQTKTTKEIKMIKKACKIATNVINEIPSIIYLGMREKELAAEMEKKMKMYGADEIAFPTIVASGKNSANPHYNAGDRKIKEGDFILVDFGCKVSNYCSDITQTFVVGKPSIKQKEMLLTCKSMNTEILKAIRPGIKYEKLQEKANAICEEKYDKLLHMIGHSLGIEVHDPINDYKKLKLEEGMILTVEPAIYVPGFGGVRIEYDVLVTKNGCRILTNF